MNFEPGGFFVQEPQVTNPDQEVQKSKDLKDNKKLMQVITKLIYPKTCKAKNKCKLIQKISKDVLKVDT